MSRLYFATLLMFISPALMADDRTSVIGFWAGESSILDIRIEGATLRATVIALRDPVYLDSEDIGTPGAQRTDNNNPEATLQNRPLIGLNLLSQYTFDDNRWEGQIYDPESGKLYSSRMSVDRRGILNMRGYIGAPMFGRTAKFVPLHECTQPMQVMLQRSQASTEVCKS